MVHRSGCTFAVMEDIPMSRLASGKRPINVCDCGAPALDRQPQQVSLGFQADVLG